MDGREGMSLPGSASFYLNRGSGGMHPSLFNTVQNPSIPMQQQNVGVAVGVGGGNCVGGGGVSGSSSTFHVENPSPSFPHGMNMPMVSASSSGEVVKKKRGRPRKYAPDGANMSLGLSPMAATGPSSGEITPKEKGRRGRPPGTGWKQKLAPLGEWMNSSAGLAFTPHVLHVGVGEDVAAKILAFAQQRPRALCIMSASGTVSSVTLRQPTTSSGSVTYEGRFEILCLSGSYLVAESGDPRNRTGGISISVCSPEGRLVGGAIGGRLIASSPVQVVGCSFVYGNNPKAKNKLETEIKDERYRLDQSAEKMSTPANAAHSQSIPPNSGTNPWPSGPQPNVKNSDIDLMRG